MGLGSDTYVIKYEIMRCFNLWGSVILNLSMSRSTGSTKSVLTFAKFMTKISETTEV